MWPVQPFSLYLTSVFLHAGCLISLLLSHCSNYCFSCKVRYFLKSNFWSVILEFVPISCIFPCTSTFFSFLIITKFLMKHHASPSLQSKFPILTLLLQKSPMLDNHSTAANDDSLGNGNPSFDQLPQYKQRMAQNESELGKIFIQGF